MSPSPRPLVELDDVASLVTAIAALLAAIAALLHSLGTRRRELLRSRRRD